MNKIITDKINEIQRLCKEYRIKTLYVFGSACSDRFRSDSDIDFLISFDQNLGIDEYSENYFALHYKLRALFGREIDIVTENSLSNPYFIKSVEQTKQLIYGTKN
ncbi:nucleotidyltransferase [Bacteroidia bacterium]|nr:nucleotidyltransferase [Bacteroidia bacterium]